jgi:hypothetical protein
MVRVQEGSFDFATRLKRMPRPPSVWPGLRYRGRRSDEPTPQDGRDEFLNGEVPARSVPAPASSPLAGASSPTESEPRPAAAKGAARIVAGLEKVASVFERGELFARPTQGRVKSERPQS